MPDLRSVVICLEDSILPRDVPQALTNLAGFLDALAAMPQDAARPLIFIRPRSSQMLAHILGFPAIECIDGFVIPKATADSLPEYLAVLSHDHHMLMPTLETREVFDGAEMRRLRDQLLAIQDRILTVRIGGNDLLQLLGARRSVARTCYDGPLGPAIANLVLAFSPWGFQLSAPVFEHFGNADLLLAEVERDLEHGLLTKTAIHPGQIATIHGAYSVDVQELNEARAILERDGKAIFASRQGDVRAGDPCRLGPADRTAQPPFRDETDRIVLPVDGELEPDPAGSKHCFPAQAGVQARRIAPMRVTPALCPFGLDPGLRRGTG